MKSLYEGSEMQVLHFKAYLTTQVATGKLQAFCVLEHHLVLHFAKEVQSTQVRQLLQTACQRKLEIHPLSLDPLHVEQFGWEPPEEICRRAEEAAKSGDFDQLRSMFPGLAKYQDEDLAKNPYLAPALRRLHGLEQPALEDCPHKLSGSFRESKRECCGKELRWVCALCDAVWCNSHGLPHRKLQQEREQVDDIVEDLKEPGTKRRRAEWFPQPPTLHVRTGRCMSEARKIEWIIQRAPELQRSERDLPLFYATYLNLFKQHSRTHERNLLKQAFECFQTFMRLEQPDYKVPACRDLPLQLRCEVESLTKGREVSRCELCKAESCSCQCRYCPRLGPHDCRLREEWRKPVCECGFKGKFEEAWTDVPKRFDMLLVLPNPPGIREGQLKHVLNKYRAEGREGKECEIWGLDIEQDEEIERKPIKPLTIPPRKLAKTLRCPECRMTFKPASARLWWPADPRA